MSDAVEKSEGVLEPETKKQKLDEETEEQRILREEEEERERERMYESDDYTDDESRQRDTREYFRQIKESGGFEVDSFPRLVGLCGKTVPIPNPEQDIELHQLSELAIAFYNKEHSTCYKFKKVLNGTIGAAAGPIFHITFSAMEGEDGSDEKCFRGSVFIQAGEETTTVLSCKLYEGKK